MENRPGGELQGDDAPRSDQPGPADPPPHGAPDRVDPGPPVSFQGQEPPSHRQGQDGADAAPPRSAAPGAAGPPADARAPGADTGRPPSPSEERPAQGPLTTGPHVPPLPFRGARPQGPQTSSWPQAHQGPPGLHGAHQPGPGTTHAFHRPGAPAPYGAPGQQYPQAGQNLARPPHAPPVQYAPYGPAAPYAQPGGPGAWPQQQQWEQPRQRRRGLGVLVGSSVAGTIAVGALVVSIVMVSTAPQEEPPPTGTDLSASYDEGLAARPNAVEIDIADHPLYDAPAPGTVDCDTPALDIGSDESWQEFATTTGECLDTLWAPVMDDLGLSSRSPEITVTRESPDTGEEEGYTLAYYESDWNRITVVLPNVRQLSAQIPVDERENVWIALMGHEYGHHVQFATGILNVSHDMRWNAGSEEDELDTLRRTELQAECMAGIGLRGITGGDEDALETVNANFNGGGDLDTHGSASNRAFWLEQGWSEETVDGCNTYGAAPGEVT
ncbi:neutral zinc metallopeptidase [Nocardiopsis codii]|uniref:neutral zinc metallopeptidase n=1 Tax=Nocardiopsis codii TaxID=3065942 RepID=UPI002E7ABA31|nr:neutral zinc metallopeptidase [Nocardiopsis sp. CT-R113]